jgi:hypothetical protein
MTDTLRSALNVYREEGLRELKRRAEQKFVDPLLHPLVNWQFKKRHGTGINVMAADWDNLLILDACRYDMFRTQNTLDGDLRREVSRGSTSTEFIDSNLRGRTLHDTVYVTANPYVNRIEDDVFHAVLTVLDEWDESLQTVMPERVVERALEAHEQYPNKRLIVHFMQPHQPYIGTTGQALRAEMKEHVDVVGWTGEKQEGVKQIRAPKIDGLDITNDDIREAYRENLSVVLDHTERLLARVDGKTVVTSDHGELLGERLLPLLRERYGHPGGLWTPKLRFVPWQTVPGHERRRVVAEKGDVHESVNRDELDAKLRALGYRA